MVNGLIMAIILLSFFVGISVDLFKLTLYQYFLFLSSPVVAISSISDDGRKLKNWKNSYFKTTFLVVIKVLMIMLYSVILKLIFDYVINGVALNNNNIFSESLLGFTSSLIYPFAALGTTYGFKAIGSKIDGYFGFGSFSAIKSIKSSVAKGTSALSAVKQGKLGATLATGGIGSLVAGVGVIHGLRKRSQNISALTSKGVDKKVAKNLLGKSDVMFNPQKQQEIVDNIKNSGIDLSKVNSKGSLETELFISKHFNQQKINSIQNSKEYKKGTASEETINELKEAINKQKATENAIKQLEENQKKIKTEQKKLNLAKGVNNVTK
nr:hypothetical protein [Metamycoplasma auris]